ncbi:penicillin-binding protein 1A [bacterium BMS3Abin14]|nr:penicillin-binding protein 1A [bacterium BMS3Abin14]
MQKIVQSPTSSHTTSVTLTSFLTERSVTCLDIRGNAGRYEVKFELKIRNIPTGRQRRRKRIKVFLTVVASMFLASVLFVAAVFFYFSLKLPKLQGIDDYKPAIPTIMYDRDGNEAHRFFTENRELISIDQVPRMVINAVLAIEDANFYHHNGLDYGGIFRAFIKNLRAGHVVQGGSTITQQVAKSLLLTNEKKYSRKIKEAILARRISKRFTKDEVLEIYLNQSYFGNGSYGIEMAALNYFGKHVWELTLPQATLLAGLPKAPSAYDPTRNPERALSRRNQVLKRMMEVGDITTAEMSDAQAAPLGLNPRRPVADDPDAYFSEEVRRYIYDKYGEDALYRGGLKVYTTMDSALQADAQAAIRRGLRNLDKRQGYRGPLEFIAAEDFDNAIEKIRVENGLGDAASGTAGEIPWKPGHMAKALVVRVDKDGAHLDLGGASGYLPLKQMKWARKPNPHIEYTQAVLKRADAALSVGALIQVRYLGKKSTQNMPLFALEQDPIAEGALVSMDASTGQILALVGGYDFSKSEFNRATQARRQPGSAFKPIVYSAAMDNGFTPSSIIVDSPIIYNDPSIDLKWKPSNYEDKFYGPTTLRTGLIKSRNVVTIKLVQKLGIQAVIQYAKRFGLDKDLPEDLSLALGSLGVTPVELTSAYTVFANLGLHASPWFVMKVVDRDGNVLEQGGAELVRSLSEDTAYILQDLLRGVVRSGTGWRAKAVKRPTGGKTGTTNDMVDAWYMGFTPRIVTGVWVGFDESASLGVNETGSRAAAPIWVYFMQKALEGRPVLPFPPPPPGIEMVKIEPNSGLLAGPGVEKFIYEGFKIGTAPREYAKVSRRRGGGSNVKSFTPGYMPPSDLPGLLPRDF